jgi:hypothetical protein
VTLRRGVLLGLFALCAFVAAGNAHAHGRSVSYSTWNLDGDTVHVRARISRLELTRLALDPVGSPRDAERVGRLLAGQLRLRSDGAACAPARDPVALPAASGWVVYAWPLACRVGGRLSITSDLLLEAAPSHLHFARVVHGDRVVERVLSEADSTWEVRGFATDGEQATASGSSLASYVTLGVEHILSGWDHLAFVLALLLLAGTVREVAALVTAFTVAHSVTLGLAVLGIVHPDGRVVEALIGFSIALVAAENAWILGGRDRIIPIVTVGALVLAAVVGLGALPRLALVGLSLFTLCHFALLRISERPARLRAAVAFAFGLIHGFGFAGVLAEMSLSVDRLAPALFGFNLGVELGQLAVVMGAWPLLRLLARVSAGRAAPLVSELVSAAICGLGLFWFVTRSFA